MRSMARLMATSAGHQPALADRNGFSAGEGRSAHFDVSPYFAIIKPTVECGFDFHNFEWVQ